MDLKELKIKVKEIENDLERYPFLKVVDFHEGNRSVSVYLTPRLKNKCKKGKVWNSRQFLITLMNAKYGYKEDNPRSGGGQDGVFLVDRKFKPRNEMQNKLFDQFINKAKEDYLSIIKEFSGPQKTFLPVRVVSHHMRLLGLLLIEECDHVILVDYDVGK